MLIFDVFSLLYWPIDCRNWILTASVEIFVLCFDIYISPPPHFLHKFDNDYVLHLGCVLSSWVTLLTWFVIFLIKLFPDPTCMKYFTSYYFFLTGLNSRQTSQWERKGRVFFYWSSLISYRCRRLVTINIL